MVVGLFSDHKEVEEAVNKLSQLDIDEGDIHVISRHHQEGNTSIIGSLGRALSPGDTPVESALTELGLGAEEARFYEQELDDTGVLVAVEADDDASTGIITALRGANGVVRD